MFLLAGALAAIVSWVVNSLLIQRLLVLTVVGFIVPVIEEISKTGFALIFETSILLTHTVFGCIEGIYEVRVVKKTGVLSGFVGLISHIFFGKLTEVLYSYNLLPQLAVFVVILVHGGWNYFMVTKKTK